ncbi:MAG TPA: GPP34 family phosphoprotein [Actinospica sp.]|nr:GPP34 family phosphoprotein [Actinospica sp.]
MAIVEGMRTLGDDIVLLAIDRDGRLRAAEKLRFAVAGSELVRLAAERRVDVVDGRIHLLDATPTGDEWLDAALVSIQGYAKPPRASRWVPSQRPGLVTRYLERLAAAGVVRVERRKALRIFTVTRWFVTDAARAAQARARLDAVARSTGQVDSEQSALGGLVHAVGLDAVLYPRSGGESNKLARERLRQIAKRDPAVRAVRSAAEAAAIDASIDASIDAAVDASVHAAVSASVHAASHAASHDGGGGGGGHH